MKVRLEGEKLLADVTRLLGGARLRYRSIEDIHEEEGCGRVADDGSKLRIVLKTPHGDGTRNEVYSLERPHGEFLDFEVSLCDEIAHGASGLWIPFESGGRKLHIRTAVNESAILIGIARFLRAKTRNFWGAATFISLVRDLTFYRYEGKPCTSGFICLQEDPGELKSAFTRKEAKTWHLEEFPGDGIPVDHSFFKSVGSYRYVDGVNKFYVASVKGPSEGGGVVHGTVEIVDRTHYSLAERATYLHLRKLLPPGETFVVLANRNGEVDVISRRYEGCFLRWSRGSWYVINLELIKAVLGENLRASKMVTAVIRAALTLSSLRYGTLILIPDDDTYLPKGKGIDESLLGKALRRQMKGRSIGELVRTGRFINALSSDGMTIVGRDGTVLDTGRIIGNVKVRAGQMGGARTVAAREASRYGVVLKVSADGPVSLFRNGKPVYDTG